MDLDNIRQEIDKIDSQIVQLLEERMHLVKTWLLIKAATGKPILIPKEELIFEKVRSRISNKNMKKQSLRLFRYSQTFA